MRKVKSKPVQVPRPSPDTGPTAERWRRGDLEAMDHAIADEEGRPSRPYRVVDTLGAMLRKGTITPAMRQAADDFHALFVIASLDPLRAPDLRRVPQGGHEVPLTL